MGDGIGKPYGKEEIDVLRRRHRIGGRLPPGDNDTPAWLRAEQILESWAVWLEEQEAEEERNGYKAAWADYLVVSREHDVLLEEIIRTRATTVGGLLAKVRAGASTLPPENGFEREIE